MEIKLAEYKHYKGNIYKVIAIAKHSETLEDMVIYQDVNSPEKIWARPAYMWNEKIELNGTMVNRFDLIEKKE